MNRLGVVTVVTAVVVAAAGAAYAATFTLNTTHLGGSAVTTPILFPDSFSTTNNGNRVGQIQKTDTATWVWSVPIDQTTLCSSWSNAQISHAITMTWTIQDNAGSTGDDLLVAGSTAGACATGLHVGTVDLGSSGYISGGNGTIASAQTSILVFGGTSTLTMTVPSGGVTGTVGTVSSGSAAVWTPDAAVTDLSAHSCGSCLAKSTATVQF